MGSLSELNFAMKGRKICFLSRSSKEPTVVAISEETPVNAVPTT